MLSARSAAALEVLTDRLHTHLVATPTIDLADAAYTLQVGRRVLGHRRVVVCRDRAEAITALATRAPGRVWTQVPLGVTRAVTLVVAPAAEARPAAAGVGLGAEAAYRAAVDACMAAVPAPVWATANAQAFTAAWAETALWTSWGITVTRVAGHGRVGAAVAACMAGGITLSDGLRWAAGDDAIPCDAAPLRRPLLVPGTDRWLQPGETCAPAACLGGDPATDWSVSAASLTADPSAVLLAIGGTAAIPTALKFDTDAPAACVLGADVAADAADALFANIAVLGRLWLEDVPVDWASFARFERRHRIALPTYPFERQRYWIDPPARTSAPVVPSSIQRAAIADWFYAPTWEETSLPTVDDDASADTMLLFAGAGTHGAAFASQLAVHGRVIHVTAGDVFRAVGDDHFTLRMSVREDYEALFDALATSHRIPRHIVHLASLGATDFAVAQDAGLYSLLALAQALGDRDLPVPVRVTVITAGACGVADADEVVPAQAPVAGACTVIGQEYLSLQCRTVDVGAGAAEITDEAAVRGVLAELRSAGGDRTVAYRGGRRYVQRFTPLPLDAPRDIASSRLRHNGVYLITGGLGTIGLHLADYLAQTVAARLILVGRSTPTPEAETKIAALRAAGADVLVHRADVADHAQMAAMFAAIDARFGALHGVIHAAGNLDPFGFAPLRDMSPARCEIHFGAKVHGLHVLEELLGSRPLDFCLIASSLSSVLGGLGDLGYAAANCYLDSYTHHHNRTSSVRWTSVNWEAWKPKPGGQTTLGGTLAHLELDPAEGQRVFARVLTSTAPQIINSTGDLNARIRQWVDLESVRETVNAPALALTGDFVEQIASLWRDLLGVPAVGVDENFFDLGGNSLIGLQLVARLRRMLQQPVPAAGVVRGADGAGAGGVPAACLCSLRSPSAATAQLAARRQRAGRTEGGHEIAVVAMTGRFPGAASVEAFWANLQAGVESVRWFSDAELRAAGIAPTLLADPAYVKARPVLDDVAHFDAGFFGYTPREAELLDPQQRLFLECAWEALERAGYDPQRYPGLIGVFAGANLNSYLFGSRRIPQVIRSRRRSVFENEQGRVDDERVLQAEPARAERDRADVLLDVARRGPPRLPEPARAASATWRWPAACRSGCRQPPATGYQRGRACCRRTATAAPFDAQAAGTAVRRRRRASWC